MKSWFRFDLVTFDPPTLVAVTLAGLLPTALLLLVSSLTLTEISISLSDALEEPHRERVRSKTRTLAAGIDQKLDRLREAVRATIALGQLDPVEMPEAFSAMQDRSLESLVWRPQREPRHVMAMTDARADLAGVALQTLRHFSKEEERREILKNIAALPPAYEDELGFSYALEASLAIGEDRLNPLSVLLSPSIDRASLLAWLKTMGDPIVVVPVCPVPLVIEANRAPEAEERVLFDSQSPHFFQIVIPEIGSGTILATLSTDRFLRNVLSVILDAEEPSDGVFYSLVRMGEAEDVKESARRAWASWPLPPPFDGEYMLVTGTESSEPPAALALLQRLEGMQLLWGGLLLVGLAIAFSLVLAALAARRVRNSMQKDDFLRLVSHELRTPIASIRMIAETLSLGRVRSEEEQQLFLRQLEAESDRLSSLVERVLEYGREDAKTLHREIVTNPVELVQDTVQRFLHFEGERKEREGGDDSELGPIEIRSSQMLHPVVLDREAVTGVLHNLLSNARKYGSPEAPIDVTVGEESRQLFISVRDMGRGIGRREQKRIFDSFYRGEGSPGKPGFGLGLAYCQQVARAHRGRVSVLSAIGRGSTFTLEIPLVRSEGESDGSDTRR